MDEGATGNGTCSALIFEDGLGMGVQSVTF